MIKKKTKHFDVWTCLLVHLLVFSMNGLTTKVHTSLKTTLKMSRHLVDMGRNPDSSLTVERSFAPHHVMSHYRPVLRWHLFPHLFNTSTVHSKLAADRVNDAKQTSRPDFVCFHGPLGSWHDGSDLAWMKTTTALPNDIF